MLWHRHSYFQSDEFEIYVITAIADLSFKIKFTNVVIFLFTELDFNMIFFFTQAEKVTWRVMKGTWKCFTTGLTTFATQSMNIFSLSGAMETAVREYSSQKTAKYNNRYR